MRRLISNLHRAAIALAAVIFVGCSGGCRHADVNRELVERELRLQEDELYRLHDEVAKREKLLESTRRENAALKRDLEQARSGAAVSPELVPAMPPAPEGEPPTRTPRTPSGIPPGDLAPPVIELPGMDGMPQGEDPPPRSSWKSSRGVRRASHEAPADDSNANAVAKIVLNRRLTGGYNGDERLGDEGIVVVAEPRNEDDRTVKLAGEISVAVVDPALSGKEARVAQWDFAADESMRYFREVAFAQGFYLKLPWTTSRPQHDRLIVFVRYTAADGSRHEASQSILVDLGGDTTEDAAVADRATSGHDD